MGLLDNLFKPRRISRTPTEVSKEPKYVEVEWSEKPENTGEYVRVVTINEFGDIENVLDYLRDRNNILILKIKPRLIQEKMELKRALKRIQRTTAAIGGDIAGVKEDIILVTPPSVKIYRGQQAEGTSTASASSSSERNEA